MHTHMRLHILPPYLLSTLAALYTIIIIIPLLPPSPVTAQSQESSELAQATGRKMYVDPSIYASTDEALRNFSKEIPPKSVRIHEEIARGMCHGNCFD